MQINTLVAEFLDQGQGRRRAADADANNMGQVRGCEARLLGQHQEIRRYAQQVGDVQFLVGQQRQKIGRVEFPQHHIGAAGMKHRVGIDVQTAGVEDRQEHKISRTVSDFNSHGALNGVIDRHLISDLGTLWPARGAGGIHQRPDIVQLPCRRHDSSGGSREAAFIVAVAAVVQACDNGNIRQVLNLSGFLGEFCAIHQRPRLRIITDVLQLGHCQTPIEG